MNYVHLFAFVRSFGWGMGGVCEEEPWSRQSSIEGGVGGGGGCMNISIHTCTCSSLHIHKTRTHKARQKKRRLSLSLSCALTSFCARNARALRICLANLRSSVSDTPWNLVYCFGSWVSLARACVLCECWEEVRDVCVYVGGLAEASPPLPPHTATSTTYPSPNNKHNANHPQTPPPTPKKQGNPAKHANQANHSNRTLRRS
jgi:hypothetical protein